MTSSPLYERIAIIGMGLIGSSLARAVHQKQLAHVLTGCDSNELSLAFARKHGFIDRVDTDPARAVAGCGLVILATPPAALADIAARIAPHLKHGAIVMDVCSVKRAAIEAIAPHLPEHAAFIPAHPIAGSAQTGVGAGRTDLFENKRIIVTLPEPDETLLNIAIAFWLALGAKVEAMPPHLHDLVYAYVSHLPQLLAFAYAPIVPDEGATDLHGFLRLCDSNPLLWTDIFLRNQDNVLKALNRYLDAIHHIRAELATPPADADIRDDDALARCVLFPRIAASCLITTVMEAEKQAGFPFARYAGAGFADVTSPALLPPDQDMEQIANHSRCIALVLDEYIERLHSLRAAIASGTALTDSLAG